MKQPSTVPDWPSAIPFLPATSEDVRVDALGNVWVGHYHFPGAITERWEVFDFERLHLAAAKDAA